MTRKKLPKESPSLPTTDNPDHNLRVSRREAQHDEDEHRPDQLESAPPVPQRQGVEDQDQPGTPYSEHGFDKDLDDIRRASPYEHFEANAEAITTAEGVEPDQSPLPLRQNDFDRHGNRRGFAAVGKDERKDQIRRGESTSGKALKGPQEQNRIRPGRS